MIEYKVAKGLRPSLDSEKGQKLKDESLSWVKNLMTSCWETDPVLRPTFSQVEVIIQKHQEELNNEPGLLDYSKIDVQIKSDLRAVSLSSMDSLEKLHKEKLLGLNVSVSEYSSGEEGEYTYETYTETGESDNSEESLEN